MTVPLILGLGPDFALLIALWPAVSPYHTERIPLPAPPGGAAKSACCPRGAPLRTAELFQISVSETWGAALLFYRKMLLFARVLISGVLGMCHF